LNLKINLTNALVSFLPDLIANGDTWISLIYPNSASFSNIYNESLDSAKQCSPSGLALLIMIVASGIINLNPLKRGETVAGPVQISSSFSQSCGPNKVVE